jgi:hypothetical protein
MDPRTEQLLFDYENALNRDDIDAAVRCFMQPAVAMSEGQVFMLDTPQACAFHLGNLVARYRTLGVGTIIHRVRGYLPMGPQAAFVDVEWLFDRQGSTLWTYHVGYQLVDVGGERRILSCTSHDTPIMRGAAGERPATGA